MNELGRKEEALIDFSKALEFDNNDEITYNNRGKN